MTMNPRPKLRLLLVCTAAFVAFFLPLQPVVAKKGSAPKSEAKEPVTVSHGDDACCAAEAGTPPPVRDERDDVVRADSKRRVFGTMMGVTLLLLCILYWSDGFGALGLRSALAARLQERIDAYRAEQAGIAGSVRSAQPSGTGSSTPN